jgi:hypothetical protein
VKKLLLFLLLSSALAHGQVANAACSKEQDQQTTSGLSGTLTFPDACGTQTNTWEMLVNGSPATVAVTINGVMRGGTTTVLGTSSSLSSTQIQTTGGPYDKYTIAYTLTGGSSPTLQFNRTATVARTAPSAVAAGVIDASKYAPNCADVGSKLVAAQLVNAGGPVTLATMSGNQIAYADNWTNSLLGTGSTNGGSLDWGSTTLYVDGPPSGAVGPAGGCQRTGQTATITFNTPLTSINACFPSVKVGSYVQILGLAAANCTQFNNTNTNPAWQVTASTPNSVSFLSSSSGTVAFTTEAAGTWKEISYSDGFGSGPMTPALAIPTKFGQIRGEGRGSAANGVSQVLNTTWYWCSGAASPFSKCNFAHPARAFNITSISFSCTAIPCPAATGSTPSNLATFTLTHDTGTGCGGDASGCTAIGLTSGSVSGSAGTVTATSTTNHGLTALTSWVTVSGCSINGYNGYFQVQSTISATQFTYSNATTGAGTGCEFDPHPVNIFLGEPAKWTGGSGFPTSTINGVAGVSQQQLPPMAIRSITNGIPPTYATETTVVMSVPPIAMYTNGTLCSGTTCNCVSNCGKLVLGTALVGYAPGYSGSETAQCVKSGCYGVANPATAFGGQIERIGLDTSGSQDGEIGLQNMYQNEHFRYDTMLIQDASLACIDMHGNIQNSGPNFSLECLWPTFTFADYGTTGVWLSAVPGATSAINGSFNRGTVNFPGGMTHQPTASYVVDIPNVTFQNMYGSRTSGNPTFDQYLVGQGNNATNFTALMDVAGATAPGAAPSNAMVHFSNNSTTSDYHLISLQNNGNGGNLLVEDDIGGFNVSNTGNPNLAMLTCDYTKSSSGLVGCVGTVPDIPQIFGLGYAIARKVTVAITAGQVLVNSGTTAGNIKVAPAAAAAGTVVGVAANTVPAVGGGTTIYVQKSGQVTSIVDTAGSCSLGNTVLVGPTTGGMVTCGAFSAGTTLGIVTSTGPVTAGNPVTYDLQLR